MGRHFFFRIKMYFFGADTVDLIKPIMGKTVCIIVWYTSVENTIYFQLAQIWLQLHHKDILNFVLYVYVSTSSVDTFRKTSGDTFL